MYENLSDPVLQLGVSSNVIIVVVVVAHHGLHKAGGCKSVAVEMPLHPNIQT